jgi:hypothetical protein
MPDRGDSDPGKAAAPGAGRWREMDVRRAINAAQKAGLSNYSVEIAPDGTISIVVGMPSARRAKPKRSAKR